MFPAPAAAAVSDVVTHTAAENADVAVVGNRSGPENRTDWDVGSGRDGDAVAGVADCGGAAALPMAPDQTPYPIPPTRTPVTFPK